MSRYTPLKYLYFCLTSEIHKWFVANKYWLKADSYRKLLCNLHIKEPILFFSLQKAIHILVAIKLVNLSNFWLLKKHCIVLLEQTRSNDESYIREHEKYINKGINRERCSISTLCETLVNKYIYDTGPMTRDLSTILARLQQYKCREANNLKF